MTLSLCLMFHEASQRGAPSSFFSRNMTIIVYCQKKSGRRKSIRGFNRMRQTLPCVKDFTRLPSGEQVTLCWSLSSLQHIHHDYAKKMNRDFQDKFSEKINTISSVTKTCKETKKCGAHRSKLNQNPLAKVDTSGEMKDRNLKAARDAVCHIQDITPDIQQVKYLVLEPGTLLLRFTLFASILFGMCHQWQKCYFSRLVLVILIYRRTRTQIISLLTHNPALTIAAVLLCRDY